MKSINKRVEPSGISRRDFLIGGGIWAGLTISKPFHALANFPLAASAPIIIDHSAVEKYIQIPQSYTDQIKRMWINVPGESHSLGYRMGCKLLHNLDPRFPVLVTESGTPAPYSDQYLRISRATWGDLNNSANWRFSYGEEDWYTSSTAIQRTKDHLTYCNTHNLAIAAMGFGWCWDMTWHNGPGGGIDPQYQVRWAGSSVGGPDGDLRWGLDGQDYNLTGNRICMDTYLGATQQFMDHCAGNNYPTRVFFTTGPVDGGGNTGENGYQRHLKHQYVRQYVQGASNRILFDYADILCWSNTNQIHTVNWTDHGGVSRQFPYIHPDNMLDLNGTYVEDGDHIGQRGALRLGKALWVMLARIAGWDPTINFTEKVYLPFIAK